MSEDVILEVQLTDQKELHCFQVIFHVQIPNREDRVPIEIFLHATQAADLFGKLGEKLMEYFARTSAELLRRVFENQEARRLLDETRRLVQRCVVTNAGWDELAHLAVKIDGFLAVTQAINHPDVKVGE